MPLPTKLAKLEKLPSSRTTNGEQTTRAILGWSQVELASRIGLTQRAVHKLEQGNTEPRRATIRIIEETWRAEGLEFEDIGDGGFRLIVRAKLLGENGNRHTRRRAASGTDTGH